MVKNSLEWASEEFFLQLFRTHPSLKGKNLRHFDEDRQAESNCIVVEAVVGAWQPQQPRPIQGYAVEVNVRYRSPGGEQAARRNDLVIAAIDESVAGIRSGQTTVEKDFAVLHFLDDITSSRENTKSLRKRERQYNLVARLKNQTESLLAR